MLPDLQALSEHDILLGHKRYYTAESLRQDVQRAGYEVEALEGIYLKPLTTAQMISCDLSPAVLQALCAVGRSYPELSCGLLAQLRAAG